jgi:DTW domain-containing protein YfiP
LSALLLPAGGKRPVCARCLRPQSACICASIVSVTHTVEVLILQHPMEVANAKGSARLLHLCLPGSRLVVGETFDALQLETLLSGKNNLLLYPDTGGPPLSVLSPVPALCTAAAMRAPTSSQRLVVLDATWRKSRKMLHQNLLLQSLPRLSLRAAPPSRYLIRKAHAPDQLSTLEATCYALMQLEPDAQLLPLIAAFDAFVAQQLRYRDL